MAKSKTKPDTSGLDLLGDGGEGGKDPLSYQNVWKLYQRGLDFNSSINLEETVKVNENFFVGEVCRR